MQLNVKAPICDTGYGIAAKNIIKGLFSDKDVDLCTIPINPNVKVDTHEQPLFSEILKNSQEPHYNGHSLKIWHQNDLMDHVGKGKKIGWPIFELDRLTMQECHHVGYCDEIIVCSEWARQIVIESLYNSYKWPHLENIVHTIPLGVDTSVFYHQPSQHEATRFFNCGKWEVRKGHDVLIKAFERVFNENDNVELYMMCHNPFPQVSNESCQRHYKSGKLAEKVFFVNRGGSHIEVANVMRQMDCGVFPARAEGFNMELLESMACGLQVITTNYSAHTEYCTVDNSKLIKIEETETANDGIWFKGQGKWAKIEDEHIDEIAQYMLDIHQKKQNGENIINTAGIQTAKKLSWENTVEKLKDVLS